MTANNPTPHIIPDTDADHPFVGQRMLIILFAAGAIGEHLQTAVMPWDDLYDEPGREPELAHHIEAVWRQFPMQWRFFGAIDSFTRRTTLTIANLGLLSMTRALEDAPPGSVADAPPPDREPPAAPIDDTPPSATRVLILLFLSGAIGEHVQTSDVAWDPIYETPGHESDIAEHVQTIWRQKGMEWRFFGAIDSHTGKIVFTMTDYGTLSMNRAHAHDTTPLAQNLPDHTL